VPNQEATREDPRRLADAVDHDNSALRRAAVSRRVLLAVGGMMLLGEAVATVAHRPGAGTARPKPSAGPAARTGGTGEAAATADRAASGATRAAPPATAPRDLASSPPAQAHGPQPAAVYSGDGRPMYYINEGRQAIALTIDDGPSPVYTPQILRLLEKYRVTATFSMVGTNVAAYPAVAREVADAGHMIVNHTWTHADLAVLAPAAVGDQISRAGDAIHRATGTVPVMFRAPYGAWSPAVFSRCEQMRLAPLDWSVDPRDWARPGVGAIVANIMANTRTGSIILEHDGGGNRAQTVAALSVVLPRLLDAGFRFRAP
jgi:peptidoglycan-N-acetylglucosamine deacetylase